MRIAALLICLALSGCGEPTTEKEREADSPLRPCKIVQVREATGWNPAVTYVQFDDGERLWRLGKWGEVGDEFKARKSNNSQWK